MRTVGILDVLTVNCCQDTRCWRRTGYIILMSYKVLLLQFSRCLVKFRSRTWSRFVFCNQWQRLQFHSKKVALGLLFLLQEPHPQRWVTAGEFAGGGGATE